MYSTPPRVQRSDNVPGSGCPSGSAKPFPVRSAWRRDSVACCGGEGRALLLVAAHGCSTAGCRDGCYYEMHPQRRVEMVTFCLNFVVILIRMFDC